MEMKKLPDAPGSLAAMLARLDQTQARHPGFPREEAALVRTVKLLQRLFNDRANASLREHGLNHAEYNVLIMLDGTPDGLSPGELAEVTSEKPANTTRLVDQLLAKGLVTRVACEHDRRRLRVQLSSEGLAMIDQLMPAIASQLQGFFSQLSPVQCAVLEQLLQQVVQGVEATP